MANDRLYVRAVALRTAATSHLSNPVLKTFGVADLLAELLRLVADMAARLEALEPSEEGGSQ